RLARTWIGVLSDPGRLTATVTEVVELRAASLTAADNLDTLDQRGVDREHALDAFTVGNLANREALAQTATRTGDANAFIGLHAGACAFRYAHENADAVAGRKLRKSALCCNFGGLFGL